MKHLHHLQIKALIAVLLMAIMAPMANAVSTFTVDYNNGKFSVTRSNTTGSETVLYRTVSLSALAGVHFAPVSGSLTFNDGDETLEVPVTEYSNVPAIYRYQNNDYRTYMLEVLDINGYYLANKVRYIGYGSGSNVTKAKFNEVKSYTISSSEFTVTDNGYKQGYHAIPFANFFNTNVPLEYLTATRCKLEMLVEFDACEVDDGYQYIQVLINETTNCDEGAKNGDPGPTEYSIYKAGFTHEGGTKNTTYAHYAFPSVADYNYYNDNDDNAGRPNYAWRDDYGNTVGRLIKQFFKARGTNNYYYYRNNDGWLELPLSDSDNSNYTLNTVGVRFDASGDFGDDWKVKNLVAKIKVDDNAGYSLFHLASEGLVVSPGPYKKGNTFYISIPADRIIVHNDNYPKLTTSWGTANYDSGSGSNVMTFKGTITADAGTVLSISSYSGTIRSLSGQTFVESIAGTTFNNCVVSEDYTLDDKTVITNLFDEPLIDNGVNKPHPFTVKWRNKTLTEGTDFTVSYADYRGPESGTKDANVIITGMGHYSGSVTGTYTIRAVELSDFNEIETGVYEIANRDDLMHLSGYVSNGKHDCRDLTFRQTANISEVGEFCPIGASTSNTTFKGTYDGQGFTISGIDASFDETPHGIGLFGKVNYPGIVQNVVVANSVFTGTSYMAPVVGYCDGGHVKNCLVGADVIVNHNSSSNDHGGVVGFAYQAVVEGCVSAAVLTIERRVGGIVGYAQSGELRNNLYTGTSVISGYSRGAILGSYAGGHCPRLYNNYYLDANQPGAVTSSDVNGARLAKHTITLGEKVIIDDEVVEYDVSGLTAYGSIALKSNGVIYSSQGNTITLGYDGASAGRTLVYYVNGTAIEGNSFEMPDENVTVTVTVTATSLISLPDVLESEDGDYIITTPVAIATINDDYAIATDGDNWLKLTGAINGLAVNDVIANIGGVLSTDQAGNPSFAVQDSEVSNEIVNYDITDIRLAICTEEQLLALTSCQLVTFEGYYKASEGTLRGHRVAPQGMSISLTFDHCEGLADGAHVKVTGALSFKEAWDAEAEGAPRRVPRTGNTAFQNLSLDVSATEDVIVTGINDVLAAGREIKDIYNLQGIKLKQPERGGIYIVVFADGTVEKVKF